MLQALTHIGLVRAANQDVALAEELPDGRALLVVADGVGGIPGGDVASRTAVDALADALRPHSDEPPDAALRRAFAAANNAVREGQQGVLARMSTTLVAAIVGDGRRGSPTSATAARTSWRTARRDSSRSTTRGWRRGSGPASWRRTTRSWRSTAT